MKLPLRIASLVFALLVLLSCGLIKGGSINGKWNIKEVAYLKAGKTFGEDFTQGYYFRFDKENLFETSNSIGTYQGQWELSGDTLIMNANGQTDRVFLNYHSRDSLVFSINLDREILKFSLTRDKHPAAKKRI